MPSKRRRGRVGTVTSGRGPRLATAVVDLSVPIYEGMPTDDLGPKFWVRLSHAASQRIYFGDHSREGRAWLTTDHVGTHLDGPLRFDRQGLSVERLPLDRTIRPARLIDLRSVGPRAIGRRELEGAGRGLEPGEAAVLWTGHDRRLKSPDYFWRRPHLNLAGAEWLAARRPAVVAADFPGIGPPDDDRFAVKRALHGGGVLTAEQLCGLDGLAGRRWHLAVAPIRTRGTAGSLVRAVGLVDWKGKRFVDLTLDIFSGMLPLSGAMPSIWTRASHELTSRFSKGANAYQTNAMFLQEHAGTHLDAPRHFDPDGQAIAELPVDRLLAPARVLDLTHVKPLEGIGPADFAGAARRAGARRGGGEAIVVWTGHSRNFERDDFGSRRPFITAAGARWLRDRNPAFIVTDLIGLDEYADKSDPVHQCLLHAGIPFAQVTTNLDRLARGTWWVAAFPLKLVDGTGAPVRVFAAAA